MNDITPEEAQEQRDVSDYPDIQAVLDDALGTLSNMKIETQYRRNYDTGRYERHTRAVGEWVKD